MSEVIEVAEESNVQKKKVATRHLGDVTFIEPAITLVPGVNWRESALKGKADMFYSVTGKVPVNGSLIPVTVNVPAVGPDGNVARLGVEPAEGRASVVTDFQPEFALRCHKEGDTVVPDETVVSEDGTVFPPEFGLKHLINRAGKTLKFLGLRITEPHLVATRDGGTKTVAEGWASGYEVVPDRAVASGPKATLSLGAAVSQAARATKAAVPAIRL